MAKIKVNKNRNKVVILILVFLGVALTLQISTIAIKKTTLCMNDYNHQMQDLLTVNKAGKLSKGDLCKDGGKIVGQLSQCLKMNRRESIISPALFVTKQENEAILTHNGGCKDYPETLVTP